MCAGLPPEAHEPQAVASIFAQRFGVDWAYDVDPPVVGTPEPVQVAEWRTISAWRIIWPQREH